MIERVEADLRRARLDRDAARVGVLSLLLAALRDAAKEAGGTLDETAALAVVRRERKRRDEAAASFREGARDEQVAEEEAAGRVIEAYLPQALSDEELERLVDEAVRETGASSPRDMGAVMKAVMARSGGRADGRTVSGLVRARLGG